MKEAQISELLRQTANGELRDVSPSLARASAITDLTLAETVGLALYDMVAAHRRTSISRETAVSMAAAGIMAMQFTSEGAARSERGAPFGSLPPTANGVAGPAGPAATESAPGDADKRHQAAVISAQSVQPGAATLASRLVAQSSALLVDDAAEALRGTNTLAMLMAAMAMARFVETGEEHCLVAVEKAKQMIIDAQDAFARATAIAAEAVETFPSS
jgi:hypothetical protein